MSMEPSNNIIGQQPCGCPFTLPLPHNPGCPKYNSYVIPESVWEQMRRALGYPWARLHHILKREIQEKHVESLSLDEFHRVLDGIQFEEGTTLDEVEAQMTDFGYIERREDRIYVLDPQASNPPQPSGPRRKRFVRVCAACIACPSLRLIDSQTCNCEQTNTLISRANALTDGVFPENCPFEDTDEPMNLKFHGVPDVERSEDNVREDIPD